MKRLHALILAATLVGCAAGPTVPSASDVQPRIDTALKEITPARQTMTALAQAGKITWAQDDAAQAALTAIRAQLLQAQSILPTDPARAFDLLSKALSDRRPTRERKMSQSSAAHIEAGAQLAAAIAAALAEKPNATMTAGSVADILGTVMETIPALAGAPQVSLVLALASIALRAFHAATTVGEGLTPSQRAALVADDDAAIAADKAAHPPAPPVSAVAPVPIPVQAAAARPLVAPMAAGQG